MDSDSPPVTCRLTHFRRTGNLMPIEEDWCGSGPCFQVSKASHEREDAHGPFRPGMELDPFWPPAPTGRLLLRRTQPVRHRMGPHGEPTDQSVVCRR